MEDKPIDPNMPSSSPSYNMPGVDAGVMGKINTYGVKVLPTDVCISLASGCLLLIYHFEVCLS